MPDPCIICVAITGSVPQKSDNPAVPITIAEQVEAAQASFEAGRQPVACACSPARWHTLFGPRTVRRTPGQVTRHCPGMIVQFSTGGRSGAGAERGGMLGLKPDMASLAVGSNNFPSRVYENPPDLVDWLAAEMQAHGVKPEIEAFDLSHIFQAVKMQQDGRLTGPLHVQFVMGVKNAMPVDRAVFDFYVATLRRLAPDATWCGAGIGAGQALLNEWSIAAGGHTRTGLEDNIRLDRHRLAPSNAALVARTAEICARHGRRPASAAEARRILGLAAPSTRLAGDAQLR